MRYGLFNENGHLVRYVHIEDGQAPTDLDLEPGWTLRDDEGAVVEFPGVSELLGHAVGHVANAARHLEMASEALLRARGVVGE